MFLKETLLCLIFILLIHQSLNHCIELERQALLKIEKDIYDSDDWLSSWRKGGDCCNWQGITCHNTTRHVISLDLHYPYDWVRANVEIPEQSKLNPSLVDLKYLMYLNLSYNDFGPSIPKFIGSLAHLKHLDMSFTGFNGTIPPQLGNLFSLQVLNIGYMLYTRVDDLHWLSRLTSLTTLQMDWVDLSSAVDWFDDITKLPLITFISFEHCSLSSIPMTVPPSNNFTFLRTFDLSSNKLNSTIPGWLFNNISSLEGLYLYKSGLYGEFPLLSGKASNLKFLELSHNNLELGELLHSDMPSPLTLLRLLDNNINASILEILWNLRNLTHLTNLQLQFNYFHGSLPKNLGNYSQLETFEIAGNYINGEIPHSIGNLIRLTSLELSDNNIEGKIPDSIGNLEKLETFDVSENRLSEKIPHSLFNLSNLVNLILASNNFCGNVPKSINLNGLAFVDLSNNRLSGSIFFSNQSSLQELNLSNNSFIGMFPFSGCITSQLQVVNLSNNSFSGAIPNLFMFHPSLGALQLDKNKFTGLIPSSLKYCKQLGFLDLSENKLCGKIPPWIGRTLLALKVLDLRSNNFTGQIPGELSYLTSLQILDLSHNHLTGNFSLYFGNFTVMTKAKNTKHDDFVLNPAYAGYLEKIWVNKQGTTRQYTSTIAYAIFIDISSNEISGEISNGITKLVGLKFLNLSRNHFIGNIPKNISAITDLEVLDLSSNELSGEIPSTMADMTFLGILNLSYNNLSGTIPIGNQFQTYDPSIYTGNNNLCGWPLPECFKTGINNTTDFDGDENEEYEYWYEKSWINAGTVVGFLISSWGIFITLLFSNPMRHLYFYYVDKLYGLITLQFHVGISMIKSKKYGN